MKFCDSHLHLNRCTQVNEYPDSFYYEGCTSCLCPKDYYETLRIINNSYNSSEKNPETEINDNCNSKNRNSETEKNPEQKEKRIIISYGIHPQFPDVDNLEFLKKLLEEERIEAIGECGFDFFSDKEKKTQKIQEDIFMQQIELSVKYDKPVILHVRKGMDELFNKILLLKKTSSVIFHGFSGTLLQAETILSKGINAYFSFGTPLLFGSRKNTECIQKLPSDRILFETDAPYQPVRNQIETFPEDIKKVYSKACSIKNLNEEKLCAQIYLNYRKAFLLEKSSEYFKCLFYST